MRDTPCPEGNCSQLSFPAEHELFPRGGGAFLHFVFYTERVAVSAVGPFAPQPRVPEAQHSDAKVTAIIGEKNTFVSAAERRNAVLGLALGGQFDGNPECFELSLRRRKQHTLDVKPTPRWHASPYVSVDASEDVRSHSL